MNAFMRRGDFWSGLALAGLGAYIVSQAWGWTYMGENGPGAGFFPLWYGSAMLLLALMLVASAVLKTDSGAGQRLLRWSEMRRALICWIALALCVAILKWVGFIIAFGLLTWFMVAIMFRRPQLEALCIATAGSVGFHALFSWGLDVRLPAGLLF